MSSSNHKRPKLTLKAAKALAKAEWGTAVGLVAHENNNAEFQRFEMRLGGLTAIITNTTAYWGVGYMYLAGRYYYFDVTTLLENHGVADKEQRKQQEEDIREMASSNSQYMIKALLNEHGYAALRRMLDEAQAYCR
jgi:hypothetical protein